MRAKTHENKFPKIISDKYKNDHFSEIGFGFLSQIFHGQSRFCLFWRIFCPWSQICLWISCHGIGTLTWILNEISFCHDCHFEIDDDHSYGFDFSFYNLCLCPLAFLHTWPSSINSDSQIASIIGTTIKSIHGILGISFIIKADKGKSTASSRTSFQGNVNISNITIFFKQWKKILRMSFEGQISDTKTGHPFNIRWWSSKRHFEFD